jgi:very-short-patch-repair endonuclease
MSSIDSQIGHVATPQGGHVHHDQLTVLGLGRHAIAHRVGRGYLIGVYHRVYAVGHLPTDPISRAKGALLAAGPRSALGGISAGSYYEIFRQWRYPLHLTVPTDHRIKGLVIHRNRCLTGQDIVTPEPNLRVVSPLIALLESAPYLSARRLERAVNEIRLRHRIGPRELQRILERFPRHPGTRRLKPILAVDHSEPSRSAWEDEWPPFAAAHGLPAYRMNHRVLGHRVDVLFSVEQLIVELDGWATHQTHAAFINDRAQDAEILARTGTPTVRITYEHFHRHPGAEAERLRQILARRRAELGRAAG